MVCSSLAGSVEQQRQLDPRDWVVWVDLRQIRQLFKQKSRTKHGGEQLGYYYLWLGLFGTWRGSGGGGGEARG